MPYLARNSLVLLASLIRPVLYLAKSEAIVMLLKKGKAKVEKKRFGTSLSLKILQLSSMLRDPC